MKYIAAQGWALAIPTLLHPHNVELIMEGYKEARELTNEKEETDQN
jgi:hypothetical protein